MDLLDLIKERRLAQQKQTEFNYGIRLASDYVQTVQDSIGIDHCYRYFANARKNISFNDVLKEAQKTLVYSNPEMDLEGEPSWITEASQPRFKNLLQDAPAGVEIPKNTLMVFRHILSSSRTDRDGDVLESSGIKVDPKMLMLWQHVHTAPIGLYLYTAEQNTKWLKVVSCIVSVNDLAEDCAVMAANKMARFSHGFRAINFTKIKAGREGQQGGFNVASCEVMEESMVSVPANPDAQLDEVLLDLTQSGKLKSAVMREVGAGLMEKRTKIHSVPIDLSIKGTAPGNVTVTITENKNHENVTAVGTGEGTQGAGTGPVSASTRQEAHAGSAGSNEAGSPAATKDAEGLATKTWTEAAREAAKAARAASERAEERSYKADNSNKPELHRQAAFSHGQASDSNSVAANELHKSGEHEEAEKYQKQSSRHAEEEDRHRESARGDKSFKALDATPASGGSEAEPIVFDNSKGGKIHCPECQEPVDPDKDGCCPECGMDLSDEMKKSFSTKQSDDEETEMLWCPECGEEVEVDENDCCTECGAQLHDWDSDDINRKAAKCGHMNKDGTFKGGFDGCVNHFTSCEGKSEEQAKGLCGKIARAVGAAPGGKSLDQLQTKNWTEAAREAANAARKAEGQRNADKDQLKKTEVGRDLMESAKTANKLSERLVATSDGDQDEASHRGAAGDHATAQTMHQNAANKASDLGLDRLAAAHQSAADAHGKAEQEHRTAARTASRAERNKSWPIDLTDMEIPLSVIEEVCPDCAARMKTKNWKSLKVKTMPAQMLDGLCNMIQSEHPFTECMNQHFGDFEDEQMGDNKKGFCAWLVKQCTGKWPGEGRGKDKSMNGTKETQVATHMISCKTFGGFGKKGVEMCNHLKEACSAGGVKMFVHSETGKKMFDLGDNEGSGICAVGYNMLNEKAADSDGVMEIHTVGRMGDQLKSVMQHIMEVAPKGKSAKVYLSTPENMQDKPGTSGGGDDLEDKSLKGSKVWGVGDDEGLCSVQMNIIKKSLDTLEGQKDWSDAAREAAAASKKAMANATAAKTKYGTSSAVKLASSKADKLSQSAKTPEEHEAAAKAHDAAADKHLEQNVDEPSTRNGAISDDPLIGNAGDHHDAAAGWHMEAAEQHREAARGLRGGKSFSTLKSGRVLNSTNLNSIKSAAESIDECTGKHGLTLTLTHKALLQKARGHLNDVLTSATGNVSDTDGDLTGASVHNYNIASAVVLAKSNSEQRQLMIKSLQAIEEVAQASALLQQYQEAIGVE